MNEQLQLPFDPNDTISVRFADREAYLEAQGYPQFPRSGWYFGGVRHRGEEDDAVGMALDTDLRWSDDR